MFGRWIRGKGGLPPSAYSFRSLLLFGKKNQPAAVGRIRRRPRPICAVMGIQSKEKPKEKKEKKSRNGNANRFWRHRQEGGRKTGPWIIFRRLHAKHLRLPLRLLHLIAITRGGEEQLKVAVASTQFRFDNFSRGSADYQVAFIYWILLSLSLVAFTVARRRALNAGRGRDYGFRDGRASSSTTNTDEHLPFFPFALCSAPILVVS